jgi:hypothetical protein
LQQTPSPDPSGGFVSNCRGASLIPPCQFERTIKDLPSRDFFLKAFDAPGKLDENLNIITPKPKFDPDRQVKNSAATAVASADGDDIQ